jgi:hypothetical protein
MTPFRHPYATSRLVSLSFETMASDSDKYVGGPNRPPITVEDNAFVSWWKPICRERLRILCGAPVRVLVNYSLHGPLHLDTQSGWGASRRGGR